MKKVMVTLIFISSAASFVPTAASACGINPMCHLQCLKETDLVQQIICHLGDPAPDAK